MCQDHGLNPFLTLSSFQSDAFKNILDYFSALTWPNKIYRNPYITVYRKCLNEKCNIYDYQIILSVLIENFDYSCMQLLLCFSILSFYRANMVSECAVVSLALTAAGIPIHNVI